MDWRFSTFLLFLFALLIGVPWLTSETGLCGLAVAQKAMTGPEATTCFEFWFNRYQTAISAVAALAAAGAAWLGVRRQIDAANRQGAIMLLSVLDARISSALQLEAVAHNIGGSVLVLREIAREVIDGAAYLGSAYKQSYQNPIMIYSFGARVEEYARLVDGLASEFESFTIEYRRGLVDLKFRTSCATIRQTAAAILANHRSRLGSLQQCAAIDYSKSPAEIELAFSAVGKFDAEAFSASPEYLSIPLGQLASGIAEMHVERERYLEQSRA